MAQPHTVTIDDWLLTETVRLREERIGRRRDDTAAVASARTAADPLPARLVARAHALPGAADIRADIRHLRRLVRNLALGLLVLGAITGVLAARGGVGEHQVDVLLSATVLLLAPTLMLLIWLALVIPRGRSRTAASLSGRLLTALLTWAGPKVFASDHAAEVTLAAARLWRTRWGCWLLSALSHAFWAFYLLFALLALIVFFATVQYDLTWGTTLLGESTVIALVGLLAEPLVGLALLPPIDAEWILAGREGGLADAHRAQWAHFLLALIAVYGLLPRLFFFGLSAVLAAISARRLALDTALPGYLRLTEALAPTAPIAAIGRETPTLPARLGVRPGNGKGRAVLIGVELDVQNWPPLCSDIDAEALGLANDRAGRKQILAALAALAQRPSALLVACSLLRTPDAGAELFIGQAADAAGTAPTLLLLDGDRWAERAAGLAPAERDSRWADWQALAERVGGRVVADPPAAGAAAGEGQQRSQGERPA